MEYVHVFINSLSDRYQNTCQLVMHHKMLLHLLLLLLLLFLLILLLLLLLLLFSLLLLSAPAAATYLTWISASGWRLTSAKIMREMWSNSSRAAGQQQGSSLAASPWPARCVVVAHVDCVVATDRIIIN